MHHRYVARATEIKTTSAETETVSKNSLRATHKATRAENVSKNHEELYVTLTRECPQLGAYVVQNIRHVF